jgi:hypothetical protein
MYQCLLPSRTAPENGTAVSQAKRLFFGKMKQELFQNLYLPIVSQLCVIIHHTGFTNPAYI